MEEHSHSEKDLKLAIVITLSIFILEVVGGLISNSLALLGDAVHVFGDFGSLLLSYLAILIAKRPPSLSKTFGYHRFEVLAALVNGSTLLLISLLIFYKAYHRLLTPVEVEPVTMLGVAVVGLLANLFVALKLHSHAGEDLNIRSAFLHVVGDALASVGVIVGGLAILLTGNKMVDPLLSFFIGMLIFFGSANVVREALHILLEGTPKHVDMEKLREDLLKIPGVLGIHDLHAWQICSHFSLASVHLQVKDRKISEMNAISNQAKEIFNAHGINHATVQFECEGEECRLSETCEPTSGLQG